jgi:hypothetical protein
MDGAKANALIRARVAVDAPESGDFELLTDDGTAEAGLLRDGGIYVNRLTPPRYPAKLTKVRIYTVQMSDQPSPEGKTVQVIVFRDAEGQGSPPAAVRIDVRKPVQLGAPRQFTEVEIPPLEIASGDVYVGFEAPKPHGGVAFAIDRDGQPSQRMFRSLDAGQTFTGPVELAGDNDQNTPANLMVRGVITYGAGEEARHQLVTSLQELDLGEGTEETFQIGVKAGEGTYRISATFDPPAPGLAATLARSQVSAGDMITVTVRSSGPSEATSASLILSAASDTSVARTTVPVYLWREIGAAEIGPDGGVVSAQGVSVRVPRGGLDQLHKLRLLTGKPATGMDPSETGPAFRIEGLPDGYNKGLEVRLDTVPTATAGIARSTRQAASEGGGVAVLRFLCKDGSGLASSVEQYQPTTVQGSTTVLSLPAGKQPLSRRFSLWMLNGWLNLISEDGNFLVFYDVTHRDTAVWLAGQLEKALLNMMGKDVDISLLDRISYVETARLLGFAVHPIRVTLRELDVPARTRGGQINFNMRRLEDAAGRMDNRSTPGHELMHIAQSLYGDNQGLVDSFLRADPTVWADEAMAVWFERYAIGEPNYLPPSMHEHMRDFLRVGPLLVPEDGARDYGYGAGAFLTYLQRYLDPTIPKRWLAQRSATRSAWATLIPLIGGDRILQQRWRYFGEALMNRQVLPNADFPDPSLLVPLESTHTFDILKDYEYEVKHWRRARDLSMEFYKLSFDAINHGGKKFGDLTDSVALGFKVQEDFDDVDLYVMDPRGKLLGAQRGKGELVLEPAGQIAASAPYLLVAAVNASYDPSPSVSSQRDISVRMGLAEPAAKITGGNFVGSRVIGYPYRFGTKNVNVPKDATYRWDFGDGRTADGRNVEYAWTRAGTFTVKLTVSFGVGKQLTDAVQVTVAPDTTTQKAEVLFDVFRVYKNAFGTSNQKCNEYYITITSPTGGSVSGESIARNGAFEITLPVADGYTYAIRYNYTGACAGSGNISGKFDVKAGTVNYVRVETPRCEN